MLLRGRDKTIKPNPDLCANRLEFVFRILLPEALHAMLPNGVVKPDCMDSLLQIEHQSLLKTAKRQNQGTFQLYRTVGATVVSSTVLYSSVHFRNFVCTWCTQKDRTELN
jgi:hypothetical protein